MSSQEEYDDYSSDEEVSTSQVHLGLVDGPIDYESTDLPTFEDSFVGGKPTWFHPDSPPNEDMLHCLNCSNPLSLLLQAFSPLETSLNDRIIYIFGCSKSSCNRKKGSIRAVRAVCSNPDKIKKLQDLNDQMNAKLTLEKESEKQYDINDIFAKKESNESSNPFAAKKNPFETSSNPFAKKEQPKQEPEPKAKAKPQNKNKSTKKTFASVASIHKDTPPKQTKLSKELPSYPGYFIYVDAEKIKPIKDTFNYKIDESVLDPNIETAPITSKSNPDSDKIQSMIDDSMFQNFISVISHNPQQVLRYNLGGEPLLYNGKDNISKMFNKNQPHRIPNPGYNPSSTRQFELQLMPKLILDLENETDFLNGMEWGTILVGTDVEDYIPEFDENHVGYVEEWCGVQWEDVVNFN